MCAVCCPNSLVVKHVLGKDESQVRFLLRAPQIHCLLGVVMIWLTTMEQHSGLKVINQGGTAQPIVDLRP